MNFRDWFARAFWCLTLLACSTAAFSQEIHTVTVGNNFFSPANLTIQVGDTVRWINAADGGPVHNVTGDTWSSPTAESFTFSRVFDEEGIEDYLCTIHPGSMTGTITVESDGGGGGTTADLVMSEVGVNNDLPYQAGGSITIDAEVDNEGNETSPAYSVDFYISTDSNITGGDTLLGTSNRNALGVGNDDNFSVQFDLPQDLSAGSYFIGAIIDIDDANNGNNTNLEDEPINVEAAPQPAELELQSVNAPAGPFAQGDTITVQSLTRNTGGQASAPYSITFYASENNVISDTDTPLGTANRPALDAGATDNSPFDAMIPADLPPGEYFIGAILGINDGNADNNVNLDNVAVQVVDGSGTAFVINNGLNDAWFNIDTMGQGFFITVFPDIEAIFLAWFTYDTERPDPSVMANIGEPGHRWLTAFGNYAGNLAQLEIELSQGGVFNSAEPPVMQSPDGTIEIEFIDCNNAVIRYDIPSAGLMGEIQVTRIAVDNVPRCQAAQPQ